MPTRNLHDPLPNDQVIDQALQILSTGFEDYSAAFATITQRACRRFEQRDWQGMRKDTVERLDLYQKVVDETQAMMQRCLGPQIHQRAVWSVIKPQFADLIQNRCDAELACTFYNSVHRKLFDTVSVDPKLTFIHPHQARGHTSSETLPLFFTLNAERVIPQTIRKILTKYGFHSPFADLKRDTRLCSIRIEQLLGSTHDKQAGVQIKMIRSAFFRGMSAYLIGALRWADQQRPLVFAMDNSSEGLHVDALLLRSDELRILFSFSRAYFHVQTSYPSALAVFLKQLMPQKRMAEIYIGLGYHKHGKTELYRDLLNHQQVCSQDRFDFAPGKRGMVMIAFSMSQDELIYKLIRDRFDSPKQTTAKQVMEKYDYVFKHDRAGRLVDVQTFENLELEECCFTPSLLSEIRKEAKRAVSILDTHVVVHHAYVERRVTPLDVFLEDADDKTAKAVVIDYGRAIKDLAQVNVFPGDMLIKNFGVTRLGRVVFYDYDELCPLTECNFRSLPQARQYEDELEAEPWFMVADDDVFPEEFASFLGFPHPLKEIFLKYHSDLLTPEFWQQAQAKIRAGVWAHIRPYGHAQQLQIYRSDGSRG